MICQHCSKDLRSQGKNKKAKYCNQSCKNANRTKTNFNTLRSRALRLWHNARIRKPDLTITVEWIEEKLKLGICEVTKLPLSVISKSPFSPSLDRKDNTLGYTPENTRVVVWMYNSAKNKFTDKDVLIMAKALVNE